MKHLFKGVHCLACDHHMPPDLFLTRCESCGGKWLEAEYDLSALAGEWSKGVVSRSHNLWRYREILPFPEDFEIVTMGEGWTPLTRAGGLENELDYTEIWVKDERQQPTGSLKDRQAAFTVSTVKARGIEEMALASTGNAAAAYAAYCARADIKLWVFLPNNVPAEKIRELALYGTEVVNVNGTYDETKVVAADFATRQGIYLDGGAKAIPGIEGMKTIALEIAEQLGEVVGAPFQAPDWYLQAVSGGIGPIGVLKGFRELHEAGLIDKVPKMGIIQAAGCSPMARAWARGLADAEPVEPDTLVIVLATGKPGMAYHILKEACDQHGGTMIAVSDGETFRAMRHVARVEGFSMEPAASVAFAGLEKLLAQGQLKPGERVVVNCSGHTFSAEKHALEDRYVFHLQASEVVEERAEGLSVALDQLEEQMTTIVLIDDRPADTRLLRRLLEKYKQYRIFEAHSAQDGIDLVKERRPDLVMLDLMMPHINGFAVLDALQADERLANIPVVIVSAKSLTIEERERLAERAESIWQKGSFSPQELVQHVAEILGDEIQPLPKAARATQKKTIKEKQQEAASRKSVVPCILVVDDYISDARLMRRLFEARQRFRVIEAHSGVETFDALEQTIPDLIILDLRLPDVDGQQLLALLREREDTKHVPVVIVSARDISPDLRARLAPEVESMWTKAAMDRSVFLSHIEKLLLSE